MIYAIAVVLVLILDQAVKLWVTGNIPLNASGDACVSLIPGFLHLTDYHNTGAAFSILENSRWVLIGVTIVFIIVIVILINREIIRAPFGKWMAVLVLAGAIGNCIDRVLYGYVVDMFEVEFMNFAIFNVADIFITVCGLLFCVHILVYREPKNAAKPVRTAEVNVPAAETQVSQAPAVGKPADKTEQLMRALRAANQSKAAQKASAPKETQSFTFGDDLDFQSAASVRAPAPAKQRKEAAAPAKAPAPAATSVPEEEPKAPVDEFSLDAIMQEFGNF